MDQNIYTIANKYWVLSQFLFEVHFILKFLLFKQKHHSCRSHKHMVTHSSKYLKLDSNTMENKDGAVCQVQGK